MHQDILTCREFCSELAPSFCLKCLIWCMPRFWLLPSQVGSCLVLFVGRNALHQTLSQRDLLFCYWGNPSWVVCPFWRIDFRVLVPWWLSVPWYLESPWYFYQHQVFFDNFIIVVTLGVLSDVCGCVTNSFWIRFFWHYCLQIIGFNQFGVSFLVQDFFELFLFDKDVNVTI